MRSGPNSLPQPTFVSAIVNATISTALSYPQRAMIRAEVTDAVRAIISRRHDKFVAAITKSKDEIPRDYARRGIGGPAAASAVLDANAGHIAQHVEALLVEIMDELDRHGAFDDEVAEWLKPEISRLIDGLGNALRGVTGMAHLRGANMTAARDSLTRTAEMRIQQAKAQAVSQITARQKLHRLKPASHSATVAQPAPTATLSGRDEQIVARLKDACPTAAPAYEQGVRDLIGADRLSYRGPVTDLREALRETLAVLAPDADVEQQPGYKREKDAKRPTWAQRAKYALRAKGSVLDATVDAVERSEELFGRFVSGVYGRANVSTHTHAGKAEAEQMLDLVRVVLHDLLGL